MIKAIVFWLACTILILAQDTPQQAGAAGKKEQAIKLDELHNNMQQDQIQKKQQQDRRAANDPVEKARLEQERRKRQERTAKYKAEQQRLRQLRRKQKETQDKRKAEMGGNFQGNFENDGQVDPTDKTKNEERRQARQAARNNKNNTPMKKIMFEVSKKIQQFIINPSTQDIMFIRFTLYVENNNVFSQVSDVRKEEPLKIYLYEDNVRIVSQGSFFFDYAISFTAKANSEYVFRFYNSGSLKLVSMMYTHFLSSEAAGKFYSSEKGALHFQKAQNLIQGVKLSLSNLQQSKIMDVKNAYQLGESMKKYFVYQIVQVIIVTIVCFLQIQFIKKMFKSVSIL